MTDRFTLRFVLSSGRPTLGDLQTLYAVDGPALVRDDDGVVTLRSGDRALARIDLLAAEHARGRALLGAILAEARRYGDEEVVQTVSFVVEHAAGVVVAKPVLRDEGDVEEALEPLDALWEFLFARFGGLLQVDGEGIYDEDGPLFEV